MAASAAMLTLFKQLIGVEDADDSDNAALNAYLNGAIVACETYLDRIVISQRSVTERLVNIRAPRVLRFVPVGVLEAVTFNSDDVASDWKLVKRTDYAELHHKTDEWFCVDYDEELEVTYQAGYETCPYDLMLAVCYTAASLRAQSGEGMEAPGRAVAKEMITGIGSVEYDKESSVGGMTSVGPIPPQSRQILDLYRGYYGL